MLNSPWCVLSMSAWLLVSTVWPDGAASAAPSAGTPDSTLRWFAGGRPTTAAREVLGDLSMAERRGLRSVDYGAAALLAAAETGASPALDARISDTVLRYHRHLTRGRVSPRAAGYALDLPREPVDPEAVLAQLSMGPHPSAELDAMEPRWHHFRLLRDALARYRDLATRDVPPRFPPLPRSLREGDHWAALPAVRRRLAFLGDLDADTTPASDALDAALVIALQRFQARHGLAADGVLGRATLAALAVPVTARVRQLELSLERARWLPAPRPGEPFILVNIPQFRLFAFDGPEDRESSMLRMDVVVGQAFEGRRTPVFTGEMAQLVLRPYWDVPRSIARREELPRLRRDPAYAARQGFELVRGERDDSPVVASDEAGLAALERGEVRLRQRPGPRNALGRIKFLFPNPYNVYLHDTPSRSLFANARRAYSHGCIRVADPLALARFVLQDQPAWTEARLAAAMDGTTPPERVRLTRPVRVMLFYATGIAAEDGRVLFFEDLYGHDARLAGLLARPDAAR